MLKVKRSTLIRWVTIIVFFFLAASNGYNLISIRGLTGYDFVGVFLIGAVISYLILNSPEKTIGTLSKGFTSYYRLTTVSICVLAVYTIITYRSQPLYLTLRVVSQYLLVIWAVPIYYIMRKDGSIKRVMEIVNVLAVVWCGLLLLQSFYFNRTGGSLFAFVESSVSGIRNDNLRISTGCLSNVALIYCFWQILNNKFRRNIYHIFCFIIQLAALLNVMQSRAYTVAISITFCVMILFDGNNQRKLARKLVLVALIASIAIGTDFIQSYFNDVFTKYEISVTARTYGYAYYWSVFLRNPVFGFGLLKDQANYGSIYSGPLRMAYIDDVGIVGQVAMLGSFCIVIVIGMYLLLFKTYFKSKKIHGKNTLLIGILTYLLATPATLMVFDQQRVCALAIIVAIFEFCSYEETKNMISEKNE